MCNYCGVGVEDIYQKRLEFDSFSEFGGVMRLCYENYYWYIEYSGLEGECAESLPIRFCPVCGRDLTEKPMTRSELEQCIKETSGASYHMQGKE